MNETAARIEITEGIGAGKVFAITGAELKIGRDRSRNAAVLEDLKVSREHCTIRRVPSLEAAFEVVANDPENGTYLNGKSISREPLRHGDHISAGRSTMKFLVGEDKEPEDVSLEDSYATYSTTEYSRSEVQRYAGGKDFAPTSARMEALLQFATEIHAIPSLRAIQHRVLGFACENLGSKEGAIVLSFNGSLDFTGGIGWKGGRPGAVPTLSRTVCSRVLSLGVALLSRDTRRDEDLRSVKSVEEGQARSVLAVPILLNRQILGLIYLQSPQANAFWDSDLRFLTAISGIAGLAIENARWADALERENEALQQRAGIEPNLVGESPAMKRVDELIRAIAPATCNVLILGETGTGKELVARAIHQASNRAGRPFVAVNCAVLSDALGESDLFGHERGAFTGAVSRREGKLEQANGGTLFLDEIGELAQSVQAKLLRVIQERQFERVGGNRTVRVDVRILAATNRDLAAETRKGSFREDLYFRLNTISLRLPPLRGRIGDIRLLAETFLRNSSAPPRKMRGISPDAYRYLIQHSWPGNVRELRNAIERALVLGNSDEIQPEDLPEEIVAATAVSQGGRYREAVARAKKDILQKGLAEAGGDVREAARILGIDLTYVYRLMGTLHVEV